MRNAIISTKKKLSSYFTKLETQFPDAKALSFNTSVLQRLRSDLSNRQKLLATFIILVVKNKTEVYNLRYEREKQNKMSKG